MYEVVRSEEVRNERGELVGCRQTVRFDELEGLEGEEFVPLEWNERVYPQTSKKSEAFFKEFCAQNEIKCCRVPVSPEDGIKSPDFLWYPSGEEVAVEIKWRDNRAGECRITPQDDGPDLYEEGKGGDVSRSRWIRSQAGEASKQLEGYKNPTILVLVDSLLLREGDGALMMNGDPRITLEQIVVAMYGHDHIPVRVEEGGDIEFGNPRRDPHDGYRMAKGRLRGISAIAHLESYKKDSEPDKVYHEISVVYNLHNEYAEDLKKHLKGIVSWSKEAEFVCPEQDFPD